MVLKSQVRGRPFDVLATNIHGMGAVRLAQSLLPALESVSGTRLERIWLPGEGPLSQFAGSQASTRYRYYRRLLPKILSRALECTILSGRLGRGRTVLTLGDIPIRVARRQVVLVHNSFVIGGSSGPSLGARISAMAMRAIFRANVGRIDAAIVQTSAMKGDLVAAYPQLEGRVHIVGQPAPGWLAEVKARNRKSRAGPLRLFYPAAGYPHKNHGLLEELARNPQAVRSGIRISLTVNPPAADGGGALLEYLGSLEPSEMVEQYADCDAILFPSFDESYGLPLIEAMMLGLPVLVSDRRYAHALCGDEAIYFDPCSTKSLALAIDELAIRIANGWQPDWSAHLQKIPQDWETVARKMVDIIDGTELSA